MNAKLIEDIANAVLYEGYMLYPYRPSSVKNRQRWNFGVVYPQSYSEAQNGADNWFMQTECIAKGGSDTELQVKVRFLQAVARTMGKLETPLGDVAFAGIGGDPEFEAVESIRVGDRTLQSWQEAVEREIVLPPIAIMDRAFAECASLVDFPGGRECESVRDPDERVAALIIRTKEAISARVEASVARINEDLLKVTVRIVNGTESKKFDAANRDGALLQSLLSAHTILGVLRGEFISMIDPPESLKEIVAGCRNAGTWPVLAGEEGQRDAMLSFPIILYDYPQIAPESPGDLFDGTEIDEILALRILTLTDEEKHEMRHADERARQILERTETMPAEHFMKLHGVLRGLRPADEGQQ